MPVARTLREEELFLDTALPVFAGVHVLSGDDEIHGHDFLEIAVVADGSGHHVTSRGGRSTSAGDVFVLRPGAWHGFTGCRSLVVANACLSTTALTHDLAFLRELAELRHLLWTGPVSAGSHGVLEHRIDRDRARDAAAELDVLAHALAEQPGAQVHLLGRLITVLGTLVLMEQPCRPENATDLPSPVRRVVERLEAVPEHPWNLSDLGELAGLDPAYLSRLFRRHLGLPPIDYLARLRAEKAATLLARSTMPAAKVGALVGWPDPTYFARRFRAMHGVSPTEYRLRSQRTVGGTHAGR